MATRKRLTAIVHGQVQGVSFRHYTMLKARELGCTGWVYNMLDKTVAVVAEGDDEQVQGLLTFLHEGSPAAHVTQVDVEWEVATGEFERFEIRYSR